MSKSIQIVAFDNPNPPDYGGVIDVYYKIKALHDLGVKVDLHFFNYGKRKDIEPLNAICNKIFQYKRNMGFAAMLSSVPFIVKSRENRALLKQLSNDPAPILFEGLHCSAFLKHPQLKNHFKLVRTHNVEHDYYEGLFKNSSKPLNKIYYKTEANKLKGYEPILTDADAILAISKQDATYFERYQKTHYLPPFHQSYKEISATGNYILFHGNLAVAENSQAVLALLNNVFNRLNHKIIVAGKSPSKNIIDAIAANENKDIQLIASPTSQEMADLISRAKCHVLYTTQNTGVKLKLVHAVQTSGHIVLNDAMLFDKIYQDEVEIANDWTTMIEKLNGCMETEDVKPRPMLRSLFDNKRNAELIMDLLP